MNFLEAINTHLQWKLRLNQYIKGELDEPLDPDIIEKDDQCVLGKWIRKNSTKLNSKTGTFEDVRIAHAYCHGTAADIVRCIQKQDKQQAIQLFEGKYSTISQSLQKNIRKLAKEFDT